MCVYKKPTNKNNLSLNLLLLSLGEFELSPSRCYPMFGFQTYRLAHRYSLHPHQAAYCKQSLLAASFVNKIYCLSNTLILQRPSQASRVSIWESRTIKKRRHRREVLFVSFAYWYNECQTIDFGLTHFDTYNKYYLCFGWNFQLERLFAVLWWLQWVR